MWADLAHFLTVVWHVLLVVLLIIIGAVLELGLLIFVIVIMYLDERRCRPKVLRKPALQIDKNKHKSR